MAARKKSPNPISLLALKSIREMTERKQIDVAQAMGVGQPEVSLLEGRDSLDNVRLHTLRRYVEALGGELELVVRFSNGDVAEIDQGAER